jgi:hypothetical protein
MSGKDRPPAPAAANATPASALAGDPASSSAQQHDGLRVALFFLKKELAWTYYNKH